ncbi:MAG TPA: hypothetical protein DCS43_04125 [Verrucomicrobia bacterium]|nr:hypothetical protein [Verrucomicrobiota bacterium]
MSELNDQQKATVTTWVREGCGLSEIQRRLTREFDMRPTFMDVRLLILDLGLDIKDAKAEQEKVNAEKAKADAALSDAGQADLDDDLGEDAGLTVEVDRLVKPGALISGTVRFSDGVKAGWMVDQMGRLSLNPETPGYRPSPEDIESFQRALQQEIAKKGY